MKRVAILAAAMLAAGVAHAADVVEEVVEPVAVGDWTGFYAGVQLGYGFGSTGQLQLDPFTFVNLVNAFTPVGLPPGSAYSGEGEFHDNFIGGVHVGYDWQFNDSWVAGAVLDVSYADISDQQRAFSRSPAIYEITRELDWMASLRARLGYLFTPSVMGYATGGITYGDIDYSYLQGPLSPAGPPTVTGGQDSEIGYTIGGGVEARVTEKISIGLEYRYTDLGGDDFQALLVNGPFGGPAGIPGSNPGGTTLTGTDDSFDFHTIELKASYRF